MWEPLVRIAIGRRRSCDKADATEQVSLKASEKETSQAVVFLDGGGDE